MSALMRLVTKVFRWRERRAQAARHVLNQTAIQMDGRPGDDNQFAQWVNDQHAQDRGESEPRQ